MSIYSEAADNEYVIGLPIRGTYDGLSHIVSKGKLIQRKCSLVHISHVACYCSFNRVSTTEYPFLHFQPQHHGFRFTSPIHICKDFVNSIYFSNLFIDQWVLNNLRVIVLEKVLLNNWKLTIRLRFSK